MVSSPLTQASRRNAYIDGVMHLLKFVLKVSTKDLVLFFMTSLTSKIAYLAAFVLTIKYVASHSKLVGALPPGFPEVVLPVTIVLVLLAWVCATKWYKVLTASIEGDISFHIRNTIREREFEILGSDPLQILPRAKRPTQSTIESVIVRTSALLAALSVVPVLLIVYVFMVFDAPDFSAILTILIAGLVFFLPAIQKRHRNSLEALNDSRLEFRARSTCEVKRFSSDHTGAQGSILEAIIDYKKSIKDAVSKREASVLYTNLTVTLVFASILFWFYFSANEIQIEDIARTVIFIVCVRLFFSNLNAFFSSISRVNQGLEDVIDLVRYFKESILIADKYIGSGMYISFVGYKPPSITDEVKNSALTFFGLSGKVSFLQWSSVSGISNTKRGEPVLAILNTLIELANKMESGDTKVLDIRYFEKLLAQELNRNSINYLPARMSQRRLGQLVLVALRAAHSAKPLILTSDKLIGVPKELINFLFSASMYIPIYIVTNLRGYNFTKLDEFQFRRFIRKLV